MNWITTEYIDLQIQWDDVTQMYFLLLFTETMSNDLFLAPAPQTGRTN